MKKIKTTEIAKKLGISHSAVSQWLNGKTFPSIKKAFRIKEEFGIPFEAWLDIKSFLKTRMEYKNR